MGILELTPSIRADTEAFEKALKALGWSKDQYHRKIKRAGLSLADKTSTKNFLNHHLKKIGSSFQYKNIMVTPTEPVHTKGAVETGMGGKPPGTRGAPKNAKIWNDGAKIQKKAIKKFPDSVTKQRKFFVDQMKKLYGKIPKKKILDIFKRTIRGIKSFSPMGLSTDLIMQMIEKNPELLNILNNQIDPSQVPMARKGGMMDINEMTKPLGYANGGFEDRMSMLRESMMDTENQRMREPDITSVAMTIARQEGDISEENINLIIRQLQALMPSLTKTMEKELTPLSTQGLKYLFDKMNVATGRKSDPRLNRSVGFGRVE